MPEVYGAKYRPIKVTIGEPQNIVVRVIDFLARNSQEIKSALAIVNRERRANGLAELALSDFRKRFILELCCKPRSIKTEEQFKDRAYELIEKISSSAKKGKEYKNPTIAKKQEALSQTILRQAEPECLVKSLQAGDMEDLAWLHSAPIEASLLPELRFVERRMMAYDKPPITGVKLSDWHRLNDRDKILVEMELCGIDRKTIIEFFEERDGTIRQRLTVLKRKLRLDAEMFQQAQLRVQSNGLNPYSLLRSRIVDFIFPNRDEIVENNLKDYHGREVSLGDYKPQKLTHLILKLLRTQSKHRQRAAHLHLQGMTSAEIAAVVNKEFNMKKPASDVARDLRFVRDEIRERLIRSLQQPAPKDIQKLPWSDWIRDKTSRRVNWLLLYLDGYRTSEIAKLSGKDFDSNSFYQIMQDFKNDFEISNDQLFSTHVSARMRRSREDKSYVDRALKLVFTEGIPRRPRDQGQQEFRENLLSELLRIVPTLKNPQNGYEFFKYRARGLSFNEMSRLSGKHKGTCKANLEVFVRNLRQKYNALQKNGCPAGLDRNKWADLTMRDQQIISMYLENETYEDILRAAKILDPNLTDIRQVYDIANTVRHKLGLSPRSEAIREKP